MKKVDNESSMNADFNNQPNRSTNYNNQPMLNNGSISGRPMQGTPMPNNVQMQGSPMPNNRPMHGTPMPNNRPMYGNPMSNNGPMNGNPFNNRAIPNNYLNENMNNNSDGIKKERTIESWIGTRGMVILASIMIVVSIVLFGKILFDDFEKVIVYSVLYTVFIGISLFGLFIFNNFFFIRNFFFSFYFFFYKYFFNNFLFYWHMCNIFFGNINIQVVQFRFPSYYGYVCALDTRRHGINV